MVYLIWVEDTSKENTMSRLTAKMVEGRIARLNASIGIVGNPYSQIGAFDLNHWSQYYSIEKYTSTGGAVTTMFSGTLAECDAFICGIQQAMYLRLQTVKE
jgi:hypothetical protein